ncbi:hypothetical protein B0H10DRAFT_1962384 [Mycena sp. CBHHK59/15]|nr:hypothetical protein B0H10DRAFT_1962384 [Mycena sp. CBHHK59/15]
MRLGHICSGWRRLALSTPILWSSIHCNTREYAEPSIIRCGELVQAWLDRSRDCPLSISNHKFAATRTTWIEELLLRVSRRLRHLDLVAHLREIPTLLKLGGDDLPILESIQLGANIGERDLDLWNNVTVFQIPSLRKVKLEAIGDVRTLPLPWSQLTELGLGCIVPWGTDESGSLNLRNGLELLRGCPTLVQCCLTITSGPPLVTGGTNQPPLSVSVRLQVANGYAWCSEAAVVQLIRARMEAGNPVEEIDIKFGRQTETDILPDLQPFISEGLRVNLRYLTAFKWEYNAREGLSLDEV